MQLRIHVSERCGKGTFSAFMLLCQDIEKIKWILVISYQITSLAFKIIVTIWIQDYRTPYFNIKKKITSFIKNYNTRRGHVAAKFIVNKVFLHSSNIHNNVWKGVFGKFYAGKYIEACIINKLNNV